MAAPRRRGTPPQAASSSGGLPWPELEREAPGPLYGLFGEEDFLLGQALEALAGLPAFQENPALNQERFQAGDTPPDRVLESARTLPFLGSRRLVILLEVQLYRAEQTARFLDYLADPVPSTTLVFAGSKLDMRSKFAKALKSRGRVHLFKRMYARQLLPWLGQRARARGKRLSAEAAAHLAELSGLGLGALDSELEKLALFVGTRGEITLEDVKEVTGRGRLYSIFDFTDALAAGRLERALAAYDQLAALGEPAVRVLAMVVRLFRQLLEAREVLDQGGGQGQVQRVLHTPPSATATITARARRESARELARRLERILETDVALKSAAASERVIMEKLVMDLCLPAVGGAG